MKKHFFLFTFFLLLLIHAKTLRAQDYLVDYTFLDNKTKLELLSLFGVLVEYDIDLYKIRYKTLDINMQPDTASGLLALPVVPENTLLPIVVLEHGTTAGPTDVPSNLQGGYEISMAYAGFGFATAAPDYLGLGDARGFHPYLHAATEASASLDMLFAMYEYLEFHGAAEADPNYLFLAGYSQGGHAAMALHEEIEKFWSIIIPVTAATHMSGPYDVSGVMRERILSEDSYGFPSYVAYIFLGYNEAYDLYDDIGEVFREPFATSIRGFYDGTINLPTLNAQLTTALAAGGDTVVKRMFHDSILISLSTDPDHPLNLALADNNVYNWAPSSPTRLYYCGNDQQVPPKNALVADSVMNALGAPDVEAIDLNPLFDHGPCVLPSIVNSIQFFLSFINPSSTDEEAGVFDIKIYPNPSLDEIIVDWETAKDGYEYHIIDTNGRVIKQGHSVSNILSLGELPAGLYFIRCSDGNLSRMARIFRQ